MSIPEIYSAINANARGNTASKSFTPAVVSGAVKCLADRNIVNDGVRPSEVNDKRIPKEEPCLLETMIKAFESHKVGANDCLVATKSESVDAACYRNWSIRFKEYKFRCATETSDQGRGRLLTFLAQYLNKRYSLSYNLISQELFERIGCFDANGTFIMTKTNGCASKKVLLPKLKALAYKLRYGYYSSMEKDSSSFACLRLEELSKVLTESRTILSKLLHKKIIPGEHIKLVESIKENLKKCNLNSDAFEADVKPHVGLCYVPRKLYGALELLIPVVGSLKDEIANKKRDLQADLAVVESSINSLPKTRQIPLVIETLTGFLNALRSWGDNWENNGGGDCPGLDSSGRVIRIVKKTGRSTSGPNGERQRLFDKLFSLAESVLDNSGWDLVPSYKGDRSVKPKFGGGDPYLRHQLTGKMLLQTLPRLIEKLEASVTELAELPASYIKTEVKKELKTAATPRWFFDDQESIPRMKEILDFADIGKYRDQQISAFCGIMKALGCMPHKIHNYYSCMPVYGGEARFKSIAEANNCDPVATLFNFVDITSEYPKFLIHMCVQCFVTSFVEKFGSKFVDLTGFDKSYVEKFVCHYKSDELSAPESYARLFFPQARLENFKNKIVMPRVNKKISELAKDEVAVKGLAAGLMGIFAILSQDEKVSKINPFDKLFSGDSNDSDATEARKIFVGILGFLFDLDVYRVVGNRSVLPLVEASQSQGHELYWVDPSFFHKGAKFPFSYHSAMS